MAWHGPSSTLRYGLLGRALAEEKPSPAKLILDNTASEGLSSAPLVVWVQSQEHRDSWAEQEPQPFPFHWPLLLPPAPYRPFPSWHPLARGSGTTGGGCGSCCQVHRAQEPRLCQAPREGRGAAQVTAPASWPSGHRPMLAPWVSPAPAPASSAQLGCPTDSPALPCLSPWAGSVSHNNGLGDLPAS